MNQMGYACINETLSSMKPKVYTGRSMIKRTFKARGIEYASELGLANCKDLFKIIKWNKENDFKFFRITSNLFPWSSEYKLHQLKHFESILADKIGLNVLIKNNKNNTGSLILEYKNLEQLNKLIEVIKSNY